MIDYFKPIFLSFLLCSASSLVQAQTPDLRFTLTANETGATKNYVAREQIILSNGFKYTAAPGLRFTARIDKTITITLADGTQIKPDGTIVKTDGTQIKPDGTIIDPDGTITRPDKTIFKPNGTIVNPNGTVVPNVSRIIPEAWFKTAPATADLNARYIWKDSSQHNVKLVKYVANGTGAEYSVGRDSVMHYNFNPALDLSSGNISKEILISKANLAQATIIGVWGARKEEANPEKFIFALNGRRNEGVLFTKSNIYSSIESGKELLSYGNDSTKNLLSLPDSNAMGRKDRERALRIASFYRSTMPNTSLWGEPKKATLSLGSSFVSANTNNTSTFSPDVNSLEGFKGYTPELLVFDRVLSPVELDIFESYLAIKYGVSLDKRYLSGTGTVIWDYASNTDFNNRITGYGREDLLGLNQKMATTSYQEAPYYSDSYDSYSTDNTLSSARRLLVVGSQPGENMLDGHYVVFGDNDKSILDSGSLMPGYRTMERKWLLNTTRASSSRVELSYFDSLATCFAGHKYDTYLIVDTSSTFSDSPQQYLTDGPDLARSKIIFNNVKWAANKKNYFTFGYKSSAQTVKKKPEPMEESLEGESTIAVYYKDSRDMTNVTVKLYLHKPSTSTLIMYDLLGKPVYRKELPETKGVQYVDIKLPSNGVYIIKAVTNHGGLSTKVMSKTGQ